MQITRLLAILLLSAAALAFAQPAAGLAQDEKGKEKKTRKPAFSVGKETTRITGPLDKDGRVDFEAALNERLREGVTPENNAVVLLLEAIGPHPGNAKVPAAVYDLLKSPAPAEKGDYFLSDDRFLRKQGGENLDQRMRKMLEDMEMACERPWSAEKYPDIAAWLKANEKPLAVATQASKRTHYYYPLVSARVDGKSQGLVSAQISPLQPIRGIAASLCARAMLRVEQKRYDDAWQDLLACHRLARLTGNGGTLIEALVGMALENIARQADLAFIDAAPLDAKKLQACLADLQKLPPMPGLADKIDLTERFCALEAVTLVDRDGMKQLELLAGRISEPDLATKTIGNWILSGAQYDPALRKMNRFYDRMTTALRGSDRAVRMRDLDAVVTDLKALKTSVTEANDIAKTILTSSSIAEAKGKWVGDVLISLIVPATIRVQNAADRREQNERNLHIAFALAAYQADQKRYPQTLDALAPKYLASVPGDLFSGKALVYRPSKGGYLLYSVGPNGEDDEGDSDDLAVRMPLPKRPR